MTSPIDALCDRLANAVRLLEKVHEHHWAAWLRADLDRIRASDRYGLDHLHQAYGGMGSFNDLVIHPANGHRVALEEVDAVNGRLDLLRLAIYDLVDLLRRQADV